MTRSRSAGGILPIVAAAAVGWFGYRTIFFPERRGAIEAIRGEAARLAARLEESDREERARGMLPEAAPDEDAAAVASELERSRRQLGALRSMVPPASEAETLLHSLPGIAAEEGLAVRRFAPEPERPVGETGREYGEAYDERPATMEAEGDFFEFVRFLERVAALPRLVLVEELDLRESPGGARHLSGRLVVVVLSREESAAGESGSGRTNGEDPAAGSPALAGAPSRGAPPAPR